LTVGVDVHQLGRKRGGGPRASVLLIGRGRTLERSLLPILDQDRDDYEVLVLVVGPALAGGAGAEPVQRAERPKVRRVFGGFASRGAAANRGIMECGGDIVLVTEGGCEVPGDWISRMIEPLLDGEEAVQGAVELGAGGLWSELEGEAGRGVVSRHRDGRHVDHLDTRNAAFRKSALEDHDLRLRLRRYGRRILFLDAVKVTDRRGTSLAAALTARRERGRWAVWIGAGRDGDETAEEIERFYFPPLLEAAAELLIGRGGRAPRPGALAARLLFEVATRGAWRLGAMAGSLAMDEHIRSISFSYS
jgi:hypothetical protein